MPAIKGTHDLLKQEEDTHANQHKRSDYCYLFPTLADAGDAGLFPDTPDDETALARLKKFEEVTRPPWEAMAPVLMDLPAAYTYFGQFMNHDISAPFGGLLVNIGNTDPPGVIGTADPQGLTKSFRADVKMILQHFVNEHAQPLNLGSLYGDGPGDAAVAGLFAEDGKRFKTAATVRLAPSFFIERKENPAAVFHAFDTVETTPAPDILRKGDEPLIADLRNDGNLILSQLHLAFMLFHNKAVKALEATHPNPSVCFARARQLVTLHYHWLILNDFLPNLLSETVLAKPLAKWQPRGIQGTGQPIGNRVPMEFTTAAFRFGHSMVGASYDFNANFGKGSGIRNPSASLMDLLGFTSHGKMRETGATQLPDHWVIDWDRMTLPLQPGAAREHGGAERIDLAITADMLNHAGNARLAGHGSIMFRNLLRGFHRRIPFGQVLADAYGLPKLSEQEISKAMQDDYAEGKTGPAADAKELGFLTHTPAWLYFLCEAKKGGGQRVGATASHIIADTIVGLMQGNPASVLNQERGNWHPRDSVLKGKGGKPIETIREFLLFATEDIKQTRLPRAP